MTLNGQIREQLKGFSSRSRRLSKRRRKQKGFIRSWATSIRDISLPTKRRERVRSISKKSLKTFRTHIMSWFSRETRSTTEHLLQWGWPRRRITTEKLLFTSLSMKVQGRKNDTGGSTTLMRTFLLHEGLFSQESQEKKKKMNQSVRATFLMIMPSPLKNEGQSQNSTWKLTMKSKKRLWKTDSKRLNRRWKRWRGSMRRRSKGWKMILATTWTELAERTLLCRVSREAKKGLRPFISQETARTTVLVSMNSLS